MGWNFSTGSQLSQSLLSIGDCLREYSPGPHPRGDETSLQAAAGSTVGTKVCIPITRCSPGRDSFQGPWHMILDPIAPSVLPLSVDIYQVVVGGVVGQGDGQEGQTSYSAMLLTSLLEIHYRNIT